MKTNLKSKISELTNYRYYVLTALSLLAILFFFGEEDWNTPFAEWIRLVLVDKVFGAACGFAAYKLFKLWDNKGCIPLVTSITKEDWNDRDEEI